VSRARAAEAFASVTSEEEVEAIVDGISIEKVREGKKKKKQRQK
jgi:hypothetical protein